MIKYKKIKRIIDEQNMKHPRRKVNAVANYDHKLDYVPSKNANVILNIKNLTKTYNPNSKKRNIKVLKGINLNIYDGDCVALIGVNGAGKTTLIEILSGVQEPTTGELHFGYNYAYSPYERVGVQFQNSYYPHGLSVIDIMRFISDTRRNITLHPNEKDDLIKKFGLQNLLHREANGLSGGQRQRLNILLALLVSPKLIFLDELTTGLDVNSQKIILQAIKEFAKRHKATLVSVSHNVLEIEKLANRIILLSNGWIKIDADVEKVKKAYKSITDFVVNFLGN